jgi:hypothetical protein
MKFTNFLTIALVTLSIATAEARPRPSGLHGKKFEANKTFGLGLELGEPFGLTGKYFLNADRALDFGVGEIYDYYYYRGYHVYGDYLWHPVSLASTDAFELPFYVGLGGRFWGWEDRRVQQRYVTGSALGFRVPVGVAFDFNSIPLDVFVEVVPTLDLFFDRPNGYDRTLYLFIDASVGIRYWFN